MITPIGLPGIITTFGSLDDPGFEKDNIVPMVFPYPLSYRTPYGLVKVNQGRCHKLLVEVFQEALAKTYEMGFISCFRPYGGIYAARSIRGLRSHPSTHSWGIAIDGNPEAYPLGSFLRMPDEVVQVWTDLGFVYGGDFTYRKDPMHFQFARDY